MGKSKSLDEAEAHFENVMEKGSSFIVFVVLWLMENLVGEAHRNTPENFKNTPTDFQFPPGFRESESL